jgi:hypothetical protein
MRQNVRPEDCLGQIGDPVFDGNSACFPPPSRRPARQGSGGSGGEKKHKSIVLFQPDGRQQTDRQRPRASCKDGGGAGKAGSEHASAVSRHPRRQSVPPGTVRGTEQCRRRRCVTARPVDCGTSRRQPQGPGGRGPTRRCLVELGASDEAPGCDRRVVSAADLRRVAHQLGDLIEALAL